MNIMHGALNRLNLKKFKEPFKLIFNGPYDTSTTEGRLRERKRRIALTAITGGVTKILAMGIPLFTLKVTYNYLGEEIYGLWNAILSFFVLFQFADLGLGNGLRTKLSQAYGREDLNMSQKLISSTFAILLLISSFLLIVLLAILPLINWSQVMNATTEKAITLASGVVFAVVASNILNIPLSLVQRTQMALQEGYKSHLWQSSAYIISLISIYLIAGLDLGPLIMIWVSSIIVVLVSGLNMVIYFTFQKKEYRPTIKKVDFKILGSLLKTGLSFFILSILTTIGLSLDNFIVARTIGLSETATYSVLYKVTLMIGGITTMLSAPMWAANGEAFARGELEWVKQSSKKMSKVLLAFSLLASVTLIVLSKPLFGIWIGGDFNFSMILLVGMCVMQIIISLASSYFMVLNAFGIIKKQILIFGIYTPISFILKYVLADRYGAVVIPWTGAIFYFLLIFLPTFYIATNCINKEMKKKQSN